MSSREEILASIRKHTQTRYEKPDIADMKRLTYPDKIEQFCAISRAVGGTAVVLGEGEDVNAVIRRTYPDAMRIASVLPDISCAISIRIWWTTRKTGRNRGSRYSGRDRSSGERRCLDTATVKYKAIYFISRNW